MRPTLWILAPLALVAAATPAAAQLTPADDSYSVARGTTLDVPDPGVLANDCCDPGADAALMSNPVHGILSFSPFGGFTYQHDGGPETTDSFTYRMMDRDAVPSTTTATVTLTITAAPPPGGEEPPNEPPPGGEPGVEDLTALVTFTEAAATGWRVSLADESLQRWEVDAAAAPATVTGSPGLPASTYALVLDPATVGASAAVRELLLECHRMALVVQTRGDSFDLVVELNFPDTALVEATEETLQIDVSAAVVSCSLAG